MIEEETRGDGAPYFVIEGIPEAKQTFTWDGKIKLLRGPFRDEKTDAGEVYIIMVEESRSKAAVSLTPEMMNELFRAYLRMREEFEEHPA